MACTPRSIVAVRSARCFNGVYRCNRALSIRLTESLQYGPICLGQLGLDLFGLSPGESEDCLTVDVFAPTNATPDSGLPVWVYFPGGGYAINSNTHYNGTGVVEQSGHNIVFVYVNYRVGVYGFLASESIRQNGDLNAGLLDQVKALEWVQRYISLVSNIVE